MGGSTLTASADPAVAAYRLPRDDPRRPAETPTDNADERIEPLLRENAAWFCRLRWIVIAVLTVAGLAGCFPRQLAGLGLVIHPAWPITAALILTALNLVFVRLASLATTDRRRLPVIPQLWAQIVTDLLMLTAVIHWLGVGLPAAPFMYLFHIILACIVFHPAESVAVTVIAAAFYLGLLLLQSVGFITKTSIFERGLGSEPATLGGVALVYHVGFMLIIWMAIWYLVSKLAATLRRRDQELAITNRRLAASSEERAEHMLQTTHHLKAPFAAIHAQTQLLLGGYCGSLPDPAKGVVDKISARCVALSRQIQGMLQLANLRSLGQVPLVRKNLNLAGMIDAAIARVQPAATQRGVRFSGERQAIWVRGVEDHLTMLLEELVANAVEYSYDGGEVTILCHAEGAHEAAVTIRDHGIGIQREKLPRIFDDYYRTDEAVLHNRTSTGLGLAIVRRVAHEARVDIQVESAPGWGTRFTVRIPDRCVGAEPKPPVPQKE